MANGVAVRNRAKELRWRRQVAAQAAGGLSIRAFCRARGLSEQNFHWWRRELRRRDAEKTVPAFVPVHVASEVPGRPRLAGTSSLATPSMAPLGTVEIVLPGDRRVRVTGKVDRQQLADVLGVLEETAPAGRREEAAG
jgi:hypothetical protein